MDEYKIEYDKSCRSIFVNRAGLGESAHFMSENLILFSRSPTVLAKDPHYFGFQINEVKKFCKDNKLPTCGWIRVLDIVRLMCHQNNPRLEKAVKEVVIPIIENHNLYEVEIPIQIPSEAS